MNQHPQHSQAFNDAIDAEVEKYQEIAAKMRHLESLGFTSIEDCGETVIFDGDYTASEIEFSEVNLTDTAADIEGKATYYSCCGDILNKDIMICPTCKEHC